MVRYSPMLSVLSLLLLSSCFAGQWYPGIIHCHSNFSDGAKSPADLAVIIRSEIKKCRNDGQTTGFMIVTEHYDGIRSKGPDACSAYPTAIRGTSIPGQFVAIGVRFVRNAFCYP